MRIFLQTAVIALVTGVAAGVAPALYETRRLHTNPLRTIATSDRIRQRWRHALVVFEIAVTIALLVVTATMIDGYWRTSRGQMGFATDPLMTARRRQPERRADAQILETLRSIPGVAAASASTPIPTAAADRGSPSPPRRPAASRSRRGTGEIDRGILLRRSACRCARDARSRQIDSSAGRVAIVNETLARQLFQGRDAVGARLWIANVPHDVVGVVADYAQQPTAGRAPRTARVRAAGARLEGRHAA